MDAWDMRVAAALAAKRVGVVMWVTSCCPGGASRLLKTQKHKF